MIHTDVLMRQVQQVIAQMAMMRKNGQFDEALQLLQETGARLFDVDFDKVTTHSYRDVAGGLRADQEKDREHMAVLAEMLRHLGELRALQERWPDAYHSLELALQLELRLAVRRETRPGTRDPVEEILEQMELSELSPTLFPDLMMHYERSGRYADAENMLFFWAEATSSRHVDEVIAEGRAFYERLHQRTDDELAAGNFSPAEVEEGCRAFQHMVGA